MQNIKSTLFKYLRQCQLINPLHRLLFFTDFDSTITQHDVCTKLVFLQKDEHILSTWNSISQQYCKLYDDKYQKNFNKYVNKKQSKREILEAVNALCGAMNEVELWGITQTESHQILKNLRKEDLHNFGKNAKTRNGASETLRHLVIDQPIKTQCHLITTNWSFDAVDGCLQGMNVPTFKNFPEISKQEKALCIFSNDLEMENHITTGKIIKFCTYAKHKLDYINHVLPKERDHYFMIYVGDALYDLPGLLEADIGIIIGEDAHLKHICVSFGIKLVHVKEVLHESFPGDVKMEPTLYVADSWKDILELFK